MGREKEYLAVNHATPLSGWMPIDSAPKDGTYILVCNHDAGVSWIAAYVPVFTSGYRPENPWASKMLNHYHAKKRYPSTVPTFWQPLPAPPQAAR